MRPATRLISKLPTTSIRPLSTLPKTHRTLTLKMSAPGVPIPTASGTPPLQPARGDNVPSQSQGLNTSTAGAGGLSGGGDGLASKLSGSGSGVGGGVGSGVGGENGGGSGGASEYGIESTSFNTAAGVELSARQKVLVGSVLDLFKGLPTLKKTSLWTDTATFADPLTKAEGRKQYEAQWWGLKAAFSEIEQLSHTITSSGNPITMDLKTRYKVKGIGSEKIIESVIKIHTSEGGEEKITKVEDRWNGNIPEGAVATAFRNLNSVVVPAFVSVPKSEAEEKK